MIVSREKLVQLRSRRNTQRKLSFSHKEQSKEQNRANHQNYNKYSNQNQFSAHTDQNHKIKQCIRNANFIKQEEYQFNQRKQLFELNINNLSSTNTSKAQRSNQTYETSPSNSLIKKNNCNSVVSKSHYQNQNRQTITGNSTKISNQYHSNNNIRSSKTNSHIISTLNKYKKMNLDVNITNKKLTTFTVQLPTGIDYRQIFSLNLSQNMIQQILPTVLVPFQFLRQLNLSRNKIQKISFPYNKMQLKKVTLNDNKISNLNLEHLKYLQIVEAQNNKLIFLTLPQSIKQLYLDRNSLSNIYFIQKCKKLEIFSINFNMVYDLNFNSFYQLDPVLNSSLKSKESIRFHKLSKIQCMNNKICHLNGFHNIKHIKQLNLKLNQICLNKQNINQLFQLQNIQILNLCENPIQGLYSIQSSFEFILNKLQSLIVFNEEKKQVWMKNNENEQSYLLENQSPIKESSLYRESQSASKQKQIENQSTIKLGQSNYKQHQVDQQIQNSQQKPFRLFLDEFQSNDKRQNQQQHQKANRNLKIKNNQEARQWIYTLGDCQQDDISENNSQIFKLMTLDNQNQTNSNIKSNQKQSSKLSQKSQKKKQLSANKHIKNNQRNKLNEKVTKLQQQLLTKQKNKVLPFSQKNQYFNLQEISLQTKNILKMILQMSFVPPRPIKYSSKQTTIHKRINQDEDQYLLFSKLFLKQGGIMYLRKIYLLQQNDLLFQSDQDLSKKQSYELKFFTHQNINSVYKLMLNTNLLLSQVMQRQYGENTLNSLPHFLSQNPYPFGCYHVIVRHLYKKVSAFQKKNLTPVCYLLESKKM